MDGVSGATGNACWNGVSTPCTELPTDSTCGCGCAEGSVCEPSADKKRAACTPPKDPDAKCTTNAACKSDNCLAGHCAVSIGAACTTYSCSDCRTVPGQAGDASFCSASCSGNACTGGVCVVTELAAANPYQVAGNANGLCYASCDLAPCANPALHCEVYVDAAQLPLGRVCVP